jgi:hypothetical protein
MGGHSSDSFYISLDIGQLFTMGYILWVRSVGVDKENERGKSKFDLCQDY